MRRGWRGPTPERPFPSLGWGFLDWTYAYLPDPRDDTKPFIYTDEQARRIVRWFEIHPITGDYLYDTLILEESKGWGKGPFAATLDIGDFVGPVCFDGWDANGEPVGVPFGTAGRRSPFIQEAALSEGQTDNTYGYVYSFLAARQGKIADNLGIDVGRTRLYLPHDPGAVLEPVTAAAGSRTGQPVTKATLDETWLWLPGIANAGRRLASTIRFNLSKTNGRSVETTNAPIRGQKSVAEMADPDHPTPGTLHYAHRARRVPEPSWTDVELDAEIRYVYKDVPWVTPSRILRDVRGSKFTWEDSVRQFFNIRWSGTGVAVDAKRWEHIAKPLGELARGTEIGAGFDGSISDDETWLRGCTREGYRFTIGRWFRPPDAPKDWRVPRGEVHAKVRWMFDYYRVGLMLCDPFKWLSEVEGWAEEFGLDKDGKARVRALETNQEARFAPAVDRWLTANAEADIESGRYTHDGDPDAAAHVTAMHLRRVKRTELEVDGRTRYVVVKGEDKRKIDGGVADILALEAAMTMADPEPGSVYETRGFKVLRPHLTCRDCGRDTVVARTDVPGWRCSLFDGGCNQIYDDDDPWIAEQLSEDA